MRNCNVFPIFLNGVAVGSEANSIAVPNANAPLTMGHSEAFYFNGQLDEVSIYNCALSDAAIDAIYRYQIALGSEETTAKINVTRRADLSSFLRLKEDETVIECQDVEIKRLDRLLPQLILQIPSPRIFLKMDAQGFDVEAFKGASGCVGSLLGLQSELSIKPIYENMPHYIEALALYEAPGLGLYNFSVVARMFGKGLVEVNCFMERAPARDHAGIDTETAVYLKHLAAGL